MKKKVKITKQLTTRRVTRAVTRSQQDKDKEEAARDLEAERQLIMSEQWVLEGRVINPAFEDPPLEIISLWKMFINSALYHPNILVHKDVQSVRDLLQIFGSFVQLETDHIIIQLQNSCNVDSSLHLLHPYSEEESCTTGLTHLLCQLKDFEFIPQLNAVIIREYKMMAPLRSALFDLVEFIATYPEALLYPNYGYLHDFLVGFGVSSDQITYEIYQTQLRRAEAKFPASTLLLKLGIPEGKTEPRCDDEYKGTDVIHDLDDLAVSEKQQRRSKSGSFSEEDSGIYSSDNLDFCSQTDKKESKVKLEIKEEGDTFQKPFQCPVCLRRYISKGNCNSHIRKRHPKDPLLPGSKNVVYTVAYFCRICKKGFTSSTYLKNHMNKSHPGISSKSSFYRKNKISRQADLKSKLYKPISSWTVSRKNRKGFQKRSSF